VTRRVRRAAIVQFSAAHELSLPLQAWALHRAGFDVELLVHPRLVPHVANCRPWARVVALGTGHHAQVVRAWTRIRRTGARLVVSNTAHGPQTRHLFWLCSGAGIRRVAVMHFVDKLANSWSTRAIADRCHGIVVFAKHLATAGNAAYPGRLHTMHPILYPEAEGVTPLRDPRWIDIGIAGAVQPDRRDYAILPTLLADPALDPRVRFVCLGRCQRDDPAVAQVLAQVAQAGQSERVLTWDGFVPQEEFHARLAGCRALCALMHPGCAEYNDFVRDQVSGVLYLGLVHRLPVLVEQAIADPLDMGPAIVPYRVEALVPAITALLEQPVTAEAIAGHPAADLEVQARQYLQACLA
jgi:hypothetical protein